MSRASRLGYDAEHAIEVYLAEHGFACVRPRAGAPQDRGDLAGLPVVVSIKNHKATELGKWMSALPRMCAAAGLPLGVVWHKRRGKASPADWYVTTDGATFLALLAAYREAGPMIKEPPPEIETVYLPGDGP